MIYERVSDRKPKGTVIYAQIVEEEHPVQYFTVVPTREEEKDMANVTSRKQLEIWECKTDDGGVGIEIDGVLHMGYDANDLMRLLREVLPGPEHDDRPLDGDLMVLTDLYLDEESARERMAEVREW